MFESRLVMVLLRVVTDGIKTPALEADEGGKGIDSLRLLGELYLCVRPVAKKLHSILECP